MMFNNSTTLVSKQYRFLTFAGFHCSPYLAGANKLRWKKTNYPKYIFLKRICRT